ncbi:sigma factor-like helix-turn-helix DNA-binding protein [Geodermatophilus normandii]|uniref:RNA polymerase sigma-70 domain-containing protein n=1 Tax=Geodermatophilus normandii TaxID=1137989 RepID=A0A6P0GBL7_9ACTN|nr:sigma factor-like helix-turn-helix DNA-binding protein [Geodermatophilus normandii]NEM05288.1 hypothetical protein [Geodermatophilus normandii]
MSPPAAAAPDDEQPVDPAYAVILEQRFYALPTRKQDILKRRLLAESPDTLDDLGASFNVTRERIRQLEKKSLAELTGVTPGKPGRRSAEQLPLPASEPESADVVLEAITAVGRLPLPVTEAALIHRGFAPLDSLGTGLLLGLAKAAVFDDQRALVAVHVGRRWLAVGARHPAALLRTVTEVVAGTGVTDDPEELSGELAERLRPHAGSAEEADDIAADLVDELQPVEIGGRYALVGGLGVIEQITHVLRANGAPMTRDALHQSLPDRNPRSIDGVLWGASSPCVRVGRAEFGLPEFGATPQPQLRKLIFEEIDRHHEVAVDHLRALAEQHGHRRTSIEFYRNLPELIEDAGILRRRGPGDPPPAGEPAFDDLCFRVIAGPDRGRWSCTLPVSAKHLRASSLHIPRPLAPLLAIDPGAQRMPIRVNGTHTVLASWMLDPYLFSRTLRPVLNALGLGDGDRMRLIVLGPAELRIEAAPHPAGPAGPPRTLTAGAALHGLDGRPVPDDEIATSLAYAVGLDPQAPPSAVLRRLRERRNTPIAEAFALLFADELDH